MLDMHLNRLRLAGYRDQTIRTKARLFRHLAVFLGDKPLHLASRDDLESFLCRDLSPASRKAYRSHMRSFYGWLVEEGHRTDNPTDRIPPIRVPRGMPRPISHEDLTLALSVARPRMRAWLLLMSLAGLRCIEVSHLRPVDLRHGPKGPTLFLRECKGGGQAVLPASAAIVEQLECLPIRNGLWWGVSPGQVSIDTAAFLHDLDIEASAHNLRHYAGTAWYEASGHDLLTTARLLRHANVATTQVYADIDPDRPAEVIRLAALKRRAS